MKLLQADKHQWGEGKVHMLVSQGDYEDESSLLTVCGRTLAICPGHFVEGGVEDITCKKCKPEAKEGNFRAKGIYYASEGCAYRGCIGSYQGIKRVLISTTNDDDDIRLHVVVECEFKHEWTIDVEHHRTMICVSAHSSVPEVGPGVDVYELKDDKIVIER